MFLGMDSRRLACQTELYLKEQRVIEQRQALGGADLELKFEAQ